MDEQRHVALPKLYGAPAYARPLVVATSPVPRPVNPDDLPLVAEMTAEDLLVFADLVGDSAPRGAAIALVDPEVPHDEAIAAAPTPLGDVQPRTFLIRQLAERIRGSRP